MIKLLPGCLYPAVFARLPYPVQQECHLQAGNDSQRIAAQSVRCKVYRHVSELLSEKCSAV